MTTQEERAMKMLGVSEEVFKKIQEAFKLFPGLWDDLAFVQMWQSIPDDACSALLKAVEEMEKMEVKHADKLAEKVDEIRKKNIKIDALEMKVRDLCETMIGIYAEDESESVKNAVIDVLGEKEFYATLVEGGYDLNDEDREAIADLLR